jgi:hypothetical protein
MSFISENTAGGTHCVQYHDGCRFDYLYLYNETSVTEIKALHKLNCPTKWSYCKFFCYLCITLHNIDLNMQYQ